MKRVTNENWKNLNGTSKRTCRCGSWIKHLENYNKSNVRSGNCSVLGCDDKADLGAHVHNDGIVGEKIIPTCGSCNKLKNEFTIKDDTILVSANTSETCG